MYKSFNGKSIFSGVHGSSKGKLSEIRNQLNQLRLFTKALESTILTKMYENYNLLKSITSSEISDLENNIDIQSISKISQSFASDLFKARMYESSLVISTQYWQNNINEIQRENNNSIINRKEAA